MREAPDGLLGSTTKFASGPASKAPDYLSKYALQAEAKDIWNGYRLMSCMSSIVPNSSVSINRVNDAPVAFYAGLMKCDSVWLCPVCSSRITEHRKNELISAIRDNPELQPFMATYTHQHHNAMPLAECIDQITTAYRRVHSGRWWQGLKSEYEIVGSVRALEMTFGFDTGWHVHIHELVFCELPVTTLTTEEQIAVIEKHAAGMDLLITSQWRLAIERVGGFADCQHGLTVSHDALGQKRLEEYISKYGRLPSVKWSLAHEVTKQPSKRARQSDRYTAFGMLAARLNGDDRFRSQLLEYAQCTFRKQQLVWSSGLKHRLGIAETADSDIQDTDREFSVLARISAEQWSEIKRSGLRGYLLQLAASGQDGALRDVLADIAEKATGFRGDWIG
jgi:hypothetical protein